MILPQRPLRLLLAAALTSALSVRADAAEDAFEFFKEEAQVVTASRRAEPAWKAPVAVDVITAEDIKAYGFREIWDALRYRAGMDVIDGRSLDGNRALVSARGFDSEFVVEMQVLVDGRSVYSPLLGGVYWQSLPVQIQDIERIEIVRGPNAALYGSNAGLGVINIITRKPGTSIAAGASASGGNRAIDKQAAFVEAGEEGKGLRVSATSRADDGHLSSSGLSNGNDFLHLNKVNASGRWTPLEKTELQFQSGASWMSAGLPGVGQAAQSQHQQNFESLRANRALGDESALELSLSRAETTIEAEPVFAGDVDIRTYQYDADLLHRFTWMDGRVKSSWGGGWRQSGADSNQVFARDPRQSNRLVRGFTQQTVRVDETLTAVGGASIEQSSTGGLQAAWQAALLATPLDNHSFRFTYSYAPTVPTLAQRSADYALAQGQTFVGNPSFGPEKLSSLETGWTGRLLDGRLKPGVALYYMEIDRYSQLAAIPYGSGTGLVSVNTDHAFARGAELSADLVMGPGRALFANYTFESITSDGGASPTGYSPARATPVHKANVGGRAALPYGFSVSSVLGYKDAYVTNSDSRGVSAPVPRHFRLDARVSWSPRPGWEVFIAGQELLQKSFTEYVDGTATPRTVRGGVEARFGR